VAGSCEHGIELSGSINWVSYSEEELHSMGLVNTNEAKTGN
jgi:hypothetical protein